MQDLGVEVKVILKWTFRNFGGKMWPGFIGLRVGFRKSCCEHGNEHFGCIKDREFPDELRHCQFLK
jgi:hypothetical protein